MKRYSAIAYDHKTDAWTKGKITCTYCKERSGAVGIWKDEKSGFYYTLRRGNGINCFVKLNGYY